MVHRRVFLSLLRLSTALLVLKGAQAQETKPDTEDDNGLDCCSHLFLSAKGILAEVQSSLLGKYKFDGVDQRKNLIYSKETEKGAFYLYYRVNGEYEHGTNGWTIGDLNGNTYSVVTRNSNPVCPEGINGAYDRDITFDPTFNIACHTNKVKVDCCPKVRLSSSSVIAKKQGAHLGEYVHNGSHDGYPMYTKKYRDVDSYLFYRKSGRPFDGWTVSSKTPDSPLYSITTRSETYCPNEITEGYHLDQEKDTTFSIVCSAKIPLDDEAKENSAGTEDRAPKEAERKEASGAGIKKQPRNAKSFPDDFDLIPVSGSSPLLTQLSYFIPFISMLTLQLLL